MTNEADQPNQSRGRGRPRMPDEDKKRHSITFRMRTELRARVAERANKNGCSISEEIERTIESHHFLSDLVGQKDAIIDDLRESVSKKTEMIKRYSELCESIRDQNRNAVAMIDRYVRNVIDSSPPDEEIIVKFGSREEAEDLLLTVKLFMGIGAPSVNDKE